MHETARAGSDETMRTATMRTDRLQQAATYAGVEKRRGAQSGWLGALRLVVFAAGVVFLIRSLRGESHLLLQGFVPAVGVFAGVVWLHGRVRVRLETARRRRMLTEESAARLAGGCGPGSAADLVARPASALDAGLAGLRDAGPLHTLSEWALADLGVEGGAVNLLALLNTTQSELGARRLRRVLRQPLLRAAAIRERQAVIQRLAQDTLLRDDLMLAYFTGRQARVRRLPAFLATPRALPGGAYRAAVGVCGALPLPLLLLGATWSWAWPLAGAVLLAALLLRLRVRHRILPLRDAYLELEPLLHKCLDVAHVLQACEPRSVLLQELQAMLRPYVGPGSPFRLQRWLRFIRCLHLHEIGVLYGPIDLLTQWDLQWLLALEATARPERTRLEQLAAATSDLEAWLALAVFAAEQPGLCQPDVFDAAEPRLEIGAGEHPLLPHGRAVPNDVELGGAVRIELVTGSNMAGKSTFLRMVALNCVLAQCGAPARAQRMRLVPVALHANINVHDSLADGKSYFLVEVERVGEVLRAAAASRLRLGIFDELFRGTNSTERLAASREVARTLAASGGLDLLATHDVELTRLVTDEGLEGAGVIHFRDEIEAGRMTFPYRAHRGTATTHNAIRLLELSGYPADLVARARRFAAGRVAAGAETKPPGP